VPVDKDPEGGEEEEKRPCLLPPNKTKTVDVVVTATSHSTTVIQAPTATTKEAPPPKKTPDFSTYEIKCYDSSQWTRRTRMIVAADEYCELNLKGYTVWEKWNPGEIESEFSRVDSEVVPVKIISYVEAKERYKWKVYVNQCKAEMRKIIDECNRIGENREQGGRIVGHCLTWRLDPNANFG
jgi:chitinase